MDYNFNKNKPLPVIILLGGKGSRFSNIDQEPKQLVRLNKNSLLASILLYYKKYKLNYFILPLGYKKEYFIKYFNNKKNIKKYSFNILNKNNDKIKSGHINIQIFNARKNSTKLYRIFKSLKYFESNHFLVTYGDGLANINFNKQLFKLRKKQNHNIVTVFKIRSQYGHVNFSKKLKVLSFKEKPYLNLPINIGYYVFNRFDFIKYFNKRDELETKFLPKLVKKNLLSIYEHKGFFFNIDNKKDLEQVKNKFKGI
tara:strand:+ start:719 stop:1483 length:765 start_codon:yes stop_codon:yes gene_type:complete